MVGITKYLFRPGVPWSVGTERPLKPRIELTVGNFSFAPPAARHWNLLLSEHFNMRLRGMGNIRVSFVFHISHYWGYICNIKLGINTDIGKKTTSLGLRNIVKQFQHAENGIFNDLLTSF